MRLQHLLFLALALLVLPACNDDDSPQPDCELTFTNDTRFFEFAHESSDATFVAWTSDTSVINDVLEQLQLPEDQRNKHINGVIERLPEGCESVNEPWSWYFPAGQWALAEFSIEVCDGNPQFVEDNIGEFVDNVGRYCPWGSYVKREISAPF